MKNIILLTLCLLLSPALAAATWTIGILALRGDTVTQAQWQPLVDTLNHAVPGEHFQLQPLDLAGMREAVNQQRIQFVLTNPAQFVQLNSNYHLRWLASLRGASADEETRKATGSVILVRRDSAIVTAHDLIGKTVGAVDPLAFGGYLLGYKALHDAGLRPGEDFRLRFSGFPADALIYLLREEAISAAIVPVCLLETMDKEGLVDKKRFRALLEKPSAQPCLASTTLYPDWSFGALPGVHDAVADAVTRALLTPHHAEAFRWGAPTSTSRVESLLRELNQHPEQQRLGLTIKSWLIQHRLSLGVLLAIVLLALANYIWVMILVNRRGRALAQANDTLRSQQQALEQARRMSLLGEMASGFAHELNQPLSAIRMYAQGSLLRLPDDGELQPVREAIGQIEKQAERGGNIIHNLRQWAAGESGSDSAPTAWTTVNVIDTLTHVWALLRMTQTHPDVALNVDGDRSLAVTVPPVLLEQVLANLLLNAVQAGATSLWATLNREDAHLILTLADNAGGVTPAQMAAIFQPFRSSRQEGMGLGLVISQRLLRNIKGDIRLENYTAPDSLQGLRATLTLPRQRKEER